MCGDVGLSQDSDGLAEILAPFCKRYGCEDCVPILRRKIERHICAGRPNKLLTLTLRYVEGACPIEAAAFLMKSWDHLSKRLRRYHGDRPMEYLHVKEGTKNGWPHLHVALRMPSVDHKLVRAWWKEITGSFIIDIRPVKHVRGVAKYLSKYLTKDLVKFGPYRVWSASRGWGKPPAREPAAPREPGRQRPARIEGGVSRHLHMLERAGYLLVYLSRRLVRAYPPHDWPEWAYQERWRRQERERDRADGVLYTGKCVV